MDTANTVPDALPPLYVALVALKPDALSLGGWATNAGVARNFFNGLKSGKKPTRDTLRKLLGVIDVDLQTFEARLSPVQTEVRGLGVVGDVEVSRMVFGTEPLARLPLYGSAVGGEYGQVDEHIELTELHLSEVLDYLSRPASLATDAEAYALTIVGDSMAPRFRPGERVAVSPRGTISIGDDVIVQLRGGEADDERVRMVLIKELVRRTATHVELRQHNPPLDFRIDVKKVAAMHKVKGHYF